MSKYKKLEVYEIVVEHNGFRYFVIYGKHLDGWFIAIPNHGICIESSDPEDVIYNSNKLSQRMNNAVVAVTLSEKIKEHWVGLDKTEEM